MESKNTLKTLCFAEIMYVINSRGYVELANLPLHLISEIVNSIQTAPILRTLYENNIKDKEILYLFEEKWKNFAKKTVLHLVAV